MKPLQGVDLECYLVYVLFVFKFDACFMYNNKL